MKQNNTTEFLDHALINTCSKNAHADHQTPHPDVFMDCPGFSIGCPFYYGMDSESSLLGVRRTHRKLLLRRAVAHDCELQMVADKLFIGSVGGTPPHSLITDQQKVRKDED